MSGPHVATSSNGALNSAAVAPAEGPTHVLTVEDAGERVDRFLARRLPDLSRSRLQRLIDDGRVLVDGRHVRSATRLPAGARVEIHVPAPRPTELMPEEMALNIVYEDSDLLVVDKPSGLVVHPAAGHADGTLVHGLLARCSDLSGVGGELRPGIVHRLDKDTSGLIMVAKNDRAHATLTAQLANRTIGKFYLALIEGEPNPPSGIVDAPIARHPSDRQRMAVIAGGRPSRTRYATLSVAGSYSLVVAGLDTGRTHQIRVHFAALGCPVAGDPIYGSTGGPAGRLWLHAWRLAFDRPSDGMRVELEAPLPSDLAESWERLTLTPETADDGLDPLLARGRRWAQVQGRERAGDPPSPAVHEERGKSR